MWRISLVRTPLGVDVTATLVRAMLHDKECQDALETSNETRQTDVVLIYSMAFIRFVNLITELGQWKMLAEAVSTVALRMGLPTWLVELRHEASHRTIPQSLSVLRAGANLALNWTRENFWEKPKPESSRSRKEQKFRECFVEIQQQLYAILGHQKTIAAVSALRGNIRFIRERIQANQRKYIAVALEEGYLLCSQEQLKLIVKEDVENDDNVQAKLMEFWFPFLRYLHKMDKKVLPTVMENLVTVLDEGTRSEHYLRIAKIWLKGIISFCTNVSSKLAADNVMQLISKALLSKCEPVKQLVPSLYTICKPYLTQEELAKVQLIMSLDTDEEDDDTDTNDGHEYIHLTGEYDDEDDDDDNNVTIKEKDEGCTAWHPCPSSEMKLLGESPLGVLPNQVIKFGAPDLKLPEFVNEFAPNAVDSVSSIGVFKRARTNPAGTWSTEELDEIRDCLEWI